MQTALPVVVENKMIQHNAVEIRCRGILKTTVFVVDQSRGQCHAHAGKGHGFPNSMRRYLFMIFATISRPPEDALRLNRMLSPR